MCSLPLMCSLQIMSKVGFKVAKRRNAFHTFTFNSFKFPIDQLLLITAVTIMFPDRAKSVKAAQVVQRQILHISHVRKDELPLSRVLFTSHHDQLMLLFQNKSKVQLQCDWRLSMRPHDFKSNFNPMNF